MSDEIKETTIRMVFLHRDFDGRKIGFLWCRVDDIENGGKIDKNDHKQRWYFIPKKGVKNLTYASPGMVFDFPTPNEGTTVYSSRASYVETWKDEAVVAEWSALDETAKAIKSAADYQKRIAKERPIFQYAIKALNKAYWQMSSRTQTAFIVWLVKEITKSPTRKG